MKQKSSKWTFSFRTFLQKPGAESFAASLIAILLGTFVGFLVMLLANPAKALPGLGFVLLGGFTDMRNLGMVLYEATPLILTGLSVGFASKTGLFNIGGAGQFIMGGFAAIFVGVKWGFLPAGLHCMVALVAAVLAGALWGMIPGLLKALFNVNEVIACIMMNYIGMSLVNLLVRRTIYDTMQNQSKRPALGAILPKMGLDKIFVAGGTASSVNSGIVVAVVAAVIIYLVLSKTRFGFEQKACGLNQHAARYAGINEKKSIVMSMMIAGGLAGLGGGLQYLAGAGQSIKVVDVLAAEGFNGIPVALLGANNPIAIIFSGLLVAHLNRGGFNVQDLYPSELVDMLTAIIIYFAALSLLFRQLVRKASSGGSPLLNKDKNQK